MNEQNLDYLKKSLEYLGFGSRLNDVLETAIRKEMTAFSLGINQHYNPPQQRNASIQTPDQIRFELNFSKSKQSDMYFLNDYAVTLNRQGDPIARKQTFDLERDNRITSMQAYKLLSGQSFEKEIFNKSEGKEQGEKTKVWFKLNLEVNDAYGNHPLRKFYPEYNFDLEKTFDKYPFKKLTELEREGALRMLRNGNMPELNITIDKKGVAVLLSANPQMKTLEVYDKNMVAIREEKIFPEQAESRKAEKQASKQAGADFSVNSSDNRMPWELDQNDDITSEIGR